MEAPLVVESSKLKTSFQHLPPRLVRWGFHPSPFKPLMIGVMPDGTICRIEFARGRKASAILAEWERAWPKTEFVQDKAATEKIIQAMTRSSKAANDKLAVYMTGTPFQQAVWKEMLKIPMGEVVSYADIARRIKRPKAVRAVGTACGANPVPLLVPCHRIVGSNGGLGGFGGGLDLKKKLLEAEGTHLAS